MFDKIIKIDDTFYNRLSVYSNNIIIIILSYLGNFFSVGLFLLFLIIFPASLRYGIISGAGLIIATLIVFVLKFTVKKRRKNYNNKIIKKLDPYSFPSGHASRLALFIISLNCLYPALIFCFITIAVSVARISRGYHDFSDCVAGAFIGAASGFTAVILGNYYAGYLMEVIINLKTVLGNCFFQ